MNDIRKLLDIINETTAGATASGGVAPVSQSMHTQRRVEEDYSEESSDTPQMPQILEYGNWENSALTTSKKLKKSRKKASKIVKSVYGEDMPGEKVAVSESVVDESGLQAYLGNKKYGKEGMDALRKAGREGASKEKMANLRAKYDKLDEEDVAETKVGNYKDLGATSDTTHFIKNVTTGKIVSPHRSRQDAEDALIANKQNSNDEFKIVRARKEGVAEGVSAQDKNISVGDYVQTAAGVEGVVKHISPDGKKLTIWNRKRQADHRVDITKAEKIPGIARRKMAVQGVAEDPMTGGLIGGALGLAAGARGASYATKKGLERVEKGPMGSDAREAGMWAKDFVQGIVDPRTYPGVKQALKTFKRRFFQDWGDGRGVTPQSIMRRAREMTTQEIIEALEFYDKHLYYYMSHKSPHILVNFQNRILQRELKRRERGEGEEHFESVVEDIASTRREVNLLKKIKKGIATPEQKKEYEALKAKNMGKPLPKQDVAVSKDSKKK